MSSIGKFRIFMVEGVPEGSQYKKTKIIRYILKTYSYIFVAQAVILTVKRSLKRRKKSRYQRKRKEKTRESEKQNSKKER